MQFKDLGIIDPILKALEDQGYKSPSPIQEKAIPPVIAGRDLLGCAQTGTGKTAAFAIPIIQHFHTTPAQLDPRGRRPIRALVLTPTRELAIQIGDSFKAYGRYAKVRYTTIFGGVGQAPQVENLRRGVDVLVATPGRLLDLMNQGFVDISRLEIFVLDEADRMLDMGFIHDVKKVIAVLPKTRQTLLFSATMPPEIAHLVDTILNDPVKVAVAPVSSTVDAIRQHLFYVDRVNKPRLLAAILKQESVRSALVFTRTKHGADKVVRELGHQQIHAKSIHGNKSQSARQEALGQFKRGDIQVLVATDIAARGIDIAELSHVINYDLPNVPETYVHRIGRTGRAGLSGTALSFCDIDEKPFLADIEKLIGKKVEEIQGHPFPMVNLTPAPKGGGQTRGAGPRRNPASNGHAAPNHNRHQGSAQSAKGGRPHVAKESPSPAPGHQGRAQNQQRQAASQGAHPPHARPVPKHAAPSSATGPQRQTAEGYQRPHGDESGRPPHRHNGAQGPKGPSRPFHRHRKAPKKPTLRELTE